MPRRLPGHVRDAIVRYLQRGDEPRSVAQIHAAVEAELGRVAPSTVRSYLNLNVGKMFERVARGVYRLVPGARL